MRLRTCSATPAADRKAVKRAVRRVLDVVGARIAFAQVRWACRRAGGRGITVLDIDNTLADTWPTLTRAWPHERKRLQAIEALPRIKAVAHDEAVARGDLIVFISHRPWRYWRETYRWLRRHGFAATPANVVLVAKPADKLAYLQCCAGAGRVVYWDDLSHSHELGEVRLYEELISAVRSLPVEYLGWREIRAIVEHPVDK
jgi:hypothetical protein